MNGDAGVKKFVRHVCVGCDHKFTRSELNSNRRCATCAKDHKKLRIQERRSQTTKVIVRPPSEARIAIRDSILEKYGGKCSHCGFSRFKSALCFHHLDPSTKAHTVATTIARYLSNPSAENYQLIITECAKCILLCANCHSALHAGEWK